MNDLNAKLKQFMPDARSLAIFLTVVAKPFNCTTYRIDLV